MFGSKGGGGFEGDEVTHPKHPVMLLYIQQYQVVLKTGR